MATPEAELATLPGFSHDIEASRAEAKRLLAEAGRARSQLTLLVRDIPMPHYAGADTHRQELEGDRRHAPSSTSATSSTGTSALKAGDFDVAQDFDGDYLRRPDLQLTKFVSHDLSPINYSGVDRPLPRRALCRPGGDAPTRGSAPTSCASSSAARSTEAYTRAAPVVEPHRRDLVRRQGLEHHAQPFHRAGSRRCVARPLSSPCSNGGRTDDRATRQRISHSEDDEGVGARRSRAASPRREAGAGARLGRGAGADRRHRGVRDRHRDHQARPAGDRRWRLAVQPWLHAGPRIYGHGGEARPLGRRVRDRRPHRGRGPCRLRPLPALPRGHVHLVPQLRLSRQGPPRQRLQHRWRLRRVRRQQRQHHGACPRRHVGRGGDAHRHRRHGDVRARRDGRHHRRRGRRRRRAGADRPHGRRRRQGAGRAAGHPHRHARAAARDGQAPRRRCRRQRDQGRCGGGGAAPHRRQGRAIRARMLGRAQCARTRRRGW